MFKRSILAAIIGMTMMSAHAANNSVDNVVGGDANGKDGYKTGVHVNNAGSGTGLADELVIDRTASGVTISTDPYNSQDADLHKVVDLTSKEYVDNQDKKTLDSAKSYTDVKVDQVVVNQSKVDAAQDQKFAEDQKRQDAALKAEEAARVAADAKIVADQKVTDNAQDDARAAGDAALEAKKADKTEVVAAKEAAIKHADKVVAAEATVRDQADKQIVADQKLIDQAQDVARRDLDTRLAQTDKALNSYTVQTNGRLDAIDRTNAAQDQKFAEDQKRQDAALADEAAKRASADAALEAKKADKTEVAAAEQRAGADAAAKAEAAKNAAITASNTYTDVKVTEVVNNQGKVDAAQDQKFAEDQKRQDTALKAEEAARVTADAKIVADQKVVDSEQDQKFADDQARQDAALATEKANRESGDAALDAKKADRTEVVAAEERAKADATAKAEAAQKAAVTASNTYTDVQVSNVVNNQAKVDAAQDEKFVKDQARQDAALKAEEDARKNANDKIVADQKVADKAQDDARKAGDAALEAKKADKTEVVAAEKAAKEHADKVVTTEKVAREAADADLDARIKKGDAALNSYKVTTDGRLDSIDRTNAVQQSQLNNHEGRISALESDVSGLKQDVKTMKSGIAGVAAMSTLVEPKFKGDTTLAVGVGVYQDAQALAVGLTHHFENGVSGKIAVAADPSAFSDTVVAGASVGYSW